MGKLLNVRLDDETHRQVLRIAKASRRSRSAVVRDAIAAYAKAQAPGRTAFEGWRDVVGIAEGLSADLSRRTSARFTEILLEERRRKRRR
jgi:predicted transcriptional regulator